MRLDNPVLFLATTNAERARVFYERVLGLAFVADEPPALLFRVGGSMLRIQKVERVHAAPYTALGWAVSDKHSVKVHWRRALAQNRLFCLPHQGKWFQTGTVADIEKAEKLLKTKTEG